MLISLGGLPGVGKTTIAHDLAGRIGAVHIRIDSIGQAIRDSGIIPSSREPHDAGYRAVYAMAEDNLKLGHTVVADCVNPIPLTRDARLQTAKLAGVRAIEVEITCSDAGPSSQRGSRGRFSSSRRRGYSRNRIDNHTLGAAVTRDPRPGEWRRVAAWRWTSAPGPWGSLA